MTDGNAAPMTDRTTDFHQDAQGPEEAGGFLDSLDIAFRERALYVALAAAWIATVGSLYFSEVRGLVPCALCWYQRILMYPLALIIAVGLLRRDRGVPAYILPLSVAGIVVATYHYLVQARVFDHSIACEQGVPCAARYINWFGFVTIPLLALVAFAVVSLATSASRSGEWATAGGPDRPWTAVGATIGGSIILIAVLHIAFG